MIRQAEKSDLDELVALGSRFFRASPHSELMAVLDSDIRDGLSNVLDGGVVFVSELDGKLVGMCAGAMTTLWFAKSIPVACEFAWWVDQEHRKGASGLKLLMAFEAWATRQGAKFICMTDLMTDGKRSDNKDLFLKLGYRAMERAMVREV